jgi:hypothetical protein
MEPEMTERFHIEGRGPWFNLFSGARFIRAFDSRREAERAQRRLARVFG